MLCQRCTSLLRASRSSAAQTQASRRTLSTSRPIRQRHALSSTTATTPPLSCQTFARPLFPVQPTTRSALHTSASLSRPAASSPSEQPTAPSPLEKPDFLNDAESVVWDRLVEEFSPVELVVQDISGGCGSMYGIEISSEKFRGANMLKQQRMVNAVLGDLMKGWHGCQLKTRVP